jgi:hypothetical protein
VLYAVALLVVVLSAVTVRSSFGRGSAEPGLAADRSTAIGAACPQPPLQTAAPVVFQDGARQLGVSIVALSYTYTPGFSPQIEVGGGLSGPLPAGQHLFLVGWADPASRDSTAAHHPGNGRYYPSAELRLTVDHCFSVPRGEMGYGGFTGMRVRGYLMLVDDAHHAAFERDGNAQDGYTQNDLFARHAVALGYTTVQTR